MDFRSDNVASAAPEIVDAVAEAARGSATPYGGDPWTEGLEPAFSELFETEVRVFPVVTGTAANSLAVATLTPPWGVIYAGRAAHVENDECGAPEFMTGGAKVTGIDERFGKIVPAALEAALAAAGTGEVHWSQPACLSLTQSTEMGQIYTPDELGVLTGIARNHGLAVHMDGARFANAVAGSGRSPADLTWRAGVDALSFGATKNGALAAEAIVLFDHEGAGDLAFRHKRAGSFSPRCASSRPNSRPTSRTASGSGWLNAPTARRAALPPALKQYPARRLRRRRRPTSSSSPCRVRSSTGWPRPASSSTAGRRPIPRRPPSASSPDTTPTRARSTR